MTHLEGAEVWSLTSLWKSLDGGSPLLGPRLPELLDIACNYYEQSAGFPHHSSFAEREAIVLDGIIGDLKAVRDTFGHQVPGDWRPGWKPWDDRRGGYHDYVGNRLHGEFITEPETRTARLSGAVSRGRVEAALNLVDNAFPGFSDGPFLHMEVLGSVTDNDLVGLSDPSLPRSAFFGGELCREDPSVPVGALARLGEQLLHETLHMVLTTSYFDVFPFRRSVPRIGRIICAAWHNPSCAPDQTRTWWTVEKSLHAFVVYAHLARYQVTMLRDDKYAEYARSRLPNSLFCAEYLFRKLDQIADAVLSPSGRAFALDLHAGLYVSKGISDHVDRYENSGLRPLEARSSDRSERVPLRGADQVWLRADATAAWDSRNAFYLVWAAPTPHRFDGTIGHLLQAIGPTPATVQDVAEKAGWPLHRAASCLAFLQARGVIDATTPPNAALAEGTTWDDHSLVDGQAAADLIMTGPIRE